jgi:hypothetical protein
VPTTIKSLTPPNRSLSIRFPKVQEIKRLNSATVRYSFRKKYPNIRMQRREINNVMRRGIAIPHEIPVLKSGSKREVSDQTFWV